MTLFLQPNVSSPVRMSNEAQIASATLQRFLNIYLRETGMDDLRIQFSPSMFQRLPAEVRTVLLAEGSPIQVFLPPAQILHGICHYHSPLGHHEYGNIYYVQHLNDPETVVPLTNWKSLVGLLLESLTRQQNLASQKAFSHDPLLARIENSFQKTLHYLEASSATTASFLDVLGADRFIRAEQSLRFGHPMHPSPKSSEGFSFEDLAHYAPELHTSFQLHYVSLSSEVLKEFFIVQDHDRLFPNRVIAESKACRLNEASSHLLPCHPWQARFLRHQPLFQKLLRDGAVIDLGPLGNVVFPTSSVRTVWDPQHSYCFKLPLNVRITNFVRINPIEHVTRAIDAARALAIVRQKLPWKHFSVLLETGYRTLAVPGHSTLETQTLQQSCTVLFRENPVMSHSMPEVPIVVAALLEPHQNPTDSVLGRTLALAAQDRADTVNLPFAQSWVERYLQIGIIPLLELFLKWGVSAEAHVQNTLVTLEKGWPIHFYLRDLEGISISYNRAKEHDWGQSLIIEKSPVLYPDEEAWKRFKYYVLVNHLGHLFFALSRILHCDERQFWCVAREVLAHSSLFEGAASHYLCNLVESEFLPAKANLVSCFLGRGERPLYVSITNPLYQRKLRYCS